VENLKEKESMRISLFNQPEKEIKHQQM